MPPGIDTKEISSLLYATARHGGGAFGHDMPWQQPDGHVYASDGRLVVRVPTSYVVGLKVDPDFWIPAVEQFFSQWNPTEVCWELPKGITAGVRPVRVGGVAIMARYVGLLLRYGVSEVFPGQRVGGPLGFTAGPCEGLLLPMDLDAHQPKFRRWGVAP